MTPSKTILLMRHAKASAPRADQNDRQRPLDLVGQREATQMGEQLLKQDLLPDLVFVSTAIRAQQTAALALQSLRYPGPVKNISRLYLAEPSDFFSLFIEVPLKTSRLLIIGHNPGVSELVFQLSRRHWVMPTASVARIDLEIEELALLNANSSAHFTQFLAPDL